MLNPNINNGSISKDSGSTPCFQPIFILSMIILGSGVSSSVFEFPPPPGLLGLFPPPFGLFGLLSPPPLGLFGFGFGFGFGVGLTGLVGLVGISFSAPV